MDFSDWITDKYVAWRGRATGNERSITDFAALIGVPQSLMSQWMKKKEKGGKVPRSQKYVTALVNVFGDEAYSVLGLPRSESSVPIEALPPAMREALLAATRELANTLAEKRIDPDSDEAERLTVSIMGKYGFKWTRTDREGSEG